MASVIPQREPARCTQAEEDPFDSLLSLESSYYSEGYTLGVDEGTRSGRTEGRLFGLEKGFQKFAQLGKLSGRAAVWQARLPSSSITVSSDMRQDGGALPLSGSDRLRKHVERLAELTDPESLETKNDEDAVNECDERLAGAQSKFTLISRIVGEDDRDESSPGGNDDARGRRANSEGLEVEVTSTTINQKDNGNDAGKKKKGGGEMEDFVTPSRVAKKMEI